MSVGDSVGISHQAVRFHFPVQRRHLRPAVDGGIARGWEGGVGGQNPKKEIRERGGKFRLERLLFFYFFFLKTIFDHL